MGENESTTHTPGVRKGNEMASEEGLEPGAEERSTTGADRPAGGTSSRYSTGINPKEPIDPSSPNLPAE